MPIVNQSTQDGGTFQLIRLRKWRGKSLALGGNAIGSYAVGILKNLKGDVDWRRVVKDSEVPRDVSIAKVGLQIFEAEEPFDVSLDNVIDKCRRTDP